MEKVEIKKFTIHLDSNTELDSFSSMLIEDIKDSFVHINTLKKGFQLDLNKQIAKMENFPILDDVVNIIYQSNHHIDEVFNDFIKNQEYFTIMFFGSVNAGKSSMICDISNTNPLTLNNLIIQLPTYDNNHDLFKIDTNVATLNLYELLFDEGNIRLVDVPGIGGLKHDNSLIIPFADMADCIVFLIDANTDAKQDELYFLEEIFVKIKSSDGEIYDNEKTVIFALNKWNSAFPKDEYTKEESEREFRRKRDAILEGGENRVGFNSLFTESNQPMMVKTNTSRRRDDTGESRSKAEIDELRDAINHVLSTKGRMIRLNRPKNVLSKEMSNMRSSLLQKRNDSIIKSSVSAFEKAGMNMKGIESRMKQETSANIEVVSQTVYIEVEKALRAAIGQWKPEVSFGNKMKMMIPDWVAQKGDWELGSTYVQKELKDKWQSEIQSLFHKNLNTEKLGQIAKKQFKEISEKLIYAFRTEMEKADPNLAKSISHSNENEDLSPQSGVYLPNMMEKVVGSIENEILNDLLTVVVAETIVLVLTKFMFFITGPGALLILGVRRLWGWLSGSDKKKEEKMRNELNRQIETGAHEASEGIKKQIEEIISTNISKLYMEYANSIDSKLKEYLAPLYLVDDTVLLIEKKRKELSEIYFEN